MELQNNEEQGQNNLNNAQNPNEQIPPSPNVAKLPDLAEPSRSHRVLTYIFTIIIIAVVIIMIYAVANSKLFTSSTTIPKSVPTTQSTSTIIPVKINYTKIPALQDFVAISLINSTPTGPSMIYLYNYSFSPPGVSNTICYTQQYTLPAFINVMSNNFTDIGGYNEVIQSQYLNSTYPLAIALFICKFSNVSSAEAYYSAQNRSTLNTIIHSSNVSIYVNRTSSLPFGNGYMGNEKPFVHSLQDSFATFIYKNYVGYVSVYGTLYNYNSSYTYNMTKQMYDRLSSSNAST
ncbi:MAG: hypothetical protein QW814_02590 [Methanothrix sp.]